MWVKVSPFLQGLMVAAGPRSVGTQAWAVAAFRANGGCLPDPGPRCIVNLDRAGAYLHRRPPIVSITGGKAAMAADVLTSTRPSPRCGVSRRWSRRGLIRRAATLGLGGAVAGRAVAVSAQDDAVTIPLAHATFEVRPDVAVPGYSIAAPEDLRADLKGSEIGTLVGAPVRDNDWGATVDARFTEVTGITVRPVDDDFLVDKVEERLAAGAADIDVFEIDVIWTARFAPLAREIDGQLQSQAAGLVGEAVDGNTVDGRLMAMPYQAGVGLLYCRLDLLEKYGLQPPETWAELEAHARLIQEGERATNPEFWGFVWFGLASEGLTCAALEWQAANGGGTIIEPDGTVSVNNPRTVAAFARAAGWIGTITPPAVHEFSSGEVRDVFAAGNAAFLRSWAHVGAEIEERATSTVKDRVVVTQLPAGDGPEGRRLGARGGASLMISRTSAKAEAAAEYVRYLTSPQIQKSMALERSRLPAVLSVYEDPDIARKVWHLPLLARIMAEGNFVSRPVVAAGRRYADVSAAYAEAVDRILKGQADAGAAVAELETRLKSILAEEA
jgi:trehalose/maltose transport system substrate-binding protein